nr:hypothetical protein [Tanacetum cinerariifolium]
MRCYSYLRSVHKLKFSKVGHVLLLGGAFGVDGNANPAADDSCESAAWNVRARCLTDCTDASVANDVGVRHTLHDKSTDSTFVENKSGGVSRASPPIGNSGEGSSFVHSEVH